MQHIGTQTIASLSPKLSVFHYDLEHANQLVLRVTPFFSEIRIFELLIFLHLIP